MSWIRRARDRLPVTLRVPIVVVCLMLFVGVSASQLVLSRLAASQERQLNDLANAYLDGLESALVEPVLRQDAWEIFDILDRARVVYAAVKPLETVVTDANGIVLAASDPRAAPIGSALPERFMNDAAAQQGVSVADAERLALILMARGRSHQTLLY